MQVNKHIQVTMDKIQHFPVLCWKTSKKVGAEDPRRIIHSLKVGLSLTLVSLLYLIEPLFKRLGSNATWAVMTVVVVLEFTAGSFFSLSNSIRVRAKTKVFIVNS